MTTFTLRKDVAADREQVVAFINELSPRKAWRVDVKPGSAGRTAEQNRLQHFWIALIALHYGDRTSAEVRADCKLRFGVPILRRDNDKYRATYDRLIRPLSYEDKLELMMEPHDFGVTRVMSVSQLTEYLESMERFYAGEGLRLPRPEDRFLEGKPA